MAKNRREQNSTPDIDLMPVISVLAVCLSFLLLTAVWVQIGSFDLNQALGTESSKEKSEDQMTLWVEFQNDQRVKFEIKVGQKTKGRWISQNGVQEIDRIASSYKSQNPDLNIAVVLPAPQSKYQDLVTVMDALRKNQITEIGIAPL